MRSPLWITLLIVAILFPCLVKASEETFPWPAHVPRPAATKKVEKPAKPQWPPVCINILGYRSCKGCQEMSPSIRRLKKLGYKIYYWDIEKRPGLPEKFGAKGKYPHVALLINGRIVQQHDGVMGVACLLDWYKHGVAVRAGKEKLDLALRYTPVTVPNSK